MHIALSILIILCAGLGSQWLAWRIRLPSIVVLIAAGLVLGPVSGIIKISLPQESLSELIGLGVALILFEGGMNLRLGEFRRVGSGVSRLTTFGPLVAWMLGTVSAHYIGGLSWPVSWVLGATLVVTGPTVIQPLLRQARLRKESASLLRWEGIVNDPVGVLLAVLTFQYFTLAESGWQDALVGLGMAIMCALLLGGVGGWLTGSLYRRGSVPPHLKAPILMVLVLLAFWLSNLVQHEAGLLTVTVMGLVIGNMHLAEREPLQQFKENLTVVLLSILFIVIPSQLKVEQFAHIDWRAICFVISILVIVRPLTVMLVTVGAPIDKKDKLLLGWIAPRGIVALATAGIFGPALIEAGYADADQLLPIVFLVIITTVLLHGLTLGPLSRRLGIAAEQENGLMIIGATPWTLELSLALKKHDIDVVVIDGSYRKLRAFRMDGIKTYYGELLSEHAEHELEDEHLSFLLCATENDYYNALVCKAQGHEFGHHRAIQLAPCEESTQEQKRLSLQQRGYYAFAPTVDYGTLNQRLEEGWVVQTTNLSREFDLEKLQDRLGVLGEEWILLGGISPKGTLQLYSKDQSFKAESDWTLIYFAKKVNEADTTHDDALAVPSLQHSTSDKDD